MENTPPTVTLAQLLAPEDRARCALEAGDGRLQLRVCGLCHDSRKVATGDVFFAYQGRVHDSHAYLPAVQAAGAALVVCREPQSNLKVPQLLHPEPRELMGRMARALYGDPAAHLTVVALTGTNGKTTTAHLVANILAAAYGRAGLMGTLGTAVVTATDTALQRSAYDEGQGLTTPEAPELLAHLARLRDAGVTAVVLEASSIALCEGRLLQAPADVAVLTNLSQDHLDYHGNMAAYAQAKAMLFASHRKPGGTTVWPHKMTAEGWAPTPPDGRLLTFSAHDAPHAGDLAGGAGPGTADIALLSPTDAQSVLDRDSGATTRLIVATPRGVLALRSPLFGQFNDENVVVAVAVAEALQLPSQAIERGLSQFEPVPGRLEPVRLAAPTEPLLPTVLVDFAHTPDALGRVLAAVRQRASGRVLLVVGCGGDRDTSKRPLMGEVAARADRFWITSDNPRSEPPEAIAAQMMAGVRGVAGAMGRCTVELDRGRAIAAAVAYARQDDVVLLAGKGHEPYQLIAGVKHPFDDRASARAALTARCGGEGFAP